MIPMIFNAMIAFLKYKQYLHIYIVIFDYIAIIDDLFLEI